MFAPPEIIETTVFTRVPDALRKTERTSSFFDGRPFAETHSFLEGPSFDREGHLYCVDLAWGRIFRVAPDGTFTVAAEYDGAPNGLRIHRDGRIFVADRARGLMMVERDSRAVRCMVEGPAGQRFFGLNDLIFAKNGDLYFTDQGETGIENPVGSVYCLRNDGRLDKVLGDIPGPNGLAFNADDSVLYLNVSRLNQVWILPFARDGRPKKVSVFLQLSGSSGGPDGIAVDEQGGVAVAHSGLGTVWVFNRAGEPLYRVKSCAGARTTNIAYGGDDGRTLFITESQTGSILQARLPVAGQRLYSHS
jgi:gluconolactonase